MKILTNYREKVFKTPPKFKKEEQSVYLLPDIQTKKTINRLKSHEAKVGYLVRRGYFRAKGRFYDIGEAYDSDIKHAKKLLGIKEKLDFSKYTPSIASQHKNKILDLSCWCAYEHKTHREELLSQAALFVDKQPNREDLLFNLLDYCWRQRVEIPSYTEFSTIISTSFRQFESKTKSCLQRYITNEQREALLELIHNPKLYSEFKKFKNISQSTRLHDLNESARILKIFQELYYKLEPVTKKLELPAESIFHFSHLVKTTTLTDLRKLQDQDELCLRLLCFVNERYVSRIDSAIAAWLKLMREWSNKGTKEEKQIKEKEDMLIASSTESVVNCTKTAMQIIDEALRLGQDSALGEGQKLTKIVDLMEAFKEAMAPNIEHNIDAVVKNLNKKKDRLDKLRYIVRHSISIQRALTPFISLLKADKDNSDETLVIAIEFLQGSVDKIDELNAPTGFLSNAEKQVLRDDSILTFTSRYKALLYWKIALAVRSKKLCFFDSFAYQPAHKLIISDEKWKKEYDRLIKASDLTDFVNKYSVMERICNSINLNIQSVNKDVIAGKNEHIKLLKDNWKLDPVEANFDASQYIPSLLSTSKKIPLYQALAELDKEIKFSQEFCLPNQIGGLTKVEKKYVYGVLISLGTNIGHHELSRSSELNEKALRDLDMKRFTNDRLIKVIRKISQHIRSIDLPSIYNSEDDEIHSSSDGKKIVVAVDSLLANYSYKYYGKEQGVTANSFVDNQQIFFHVNVMSSSDREAAYMMDGLVKSKNNLYEEAQRDPFVRKLDDETFDRRTHQHSTDNHGYTEAIFSGLYFMHVSFAPRLKGIEDSTLYAPSNKFTKSKTGYPIAPKTKINKQLILDNWDNILRFMATIKLGYASASTLFRMLSASGDSILYKALKEFGRLLKTQFIYNYISNHDARRKIQKQLNRAELGQKLIDAIFHGRQSKLRTGDSDEINKIFQCTKILENIIVFWNYLYLQKYLLQIDSKKEREDEILRISAGSVIAWAHFNMAGTYDFSNLDNDSFGVPLSKLMSAKVT